MQLTLQGKTFVIFHSKHGKRLLVNFCHTFCHTEVSSRAKLRNLGINVVLQTGTAGRGGRWLAMEQGSGTRSQLLTFGKVTPLLLSPTIFFHMPRAAFFTPKRNSPSFFGSEGLPLWGRTPKSAASHTGHTKAARGNTEDVSRRTMQCDGDVMHEAPGQL